MPLYFFDCEHRGCEEECVGHDLEDHDAAHRMGIVFASEILQDDPQALTDGHDLRVTVSNQDHLVLYSFYATTTPSPAAKRTR